MNNSRKWIIKLSGDFQPFDVEGLEEIYLNSDIEIDNSNKLDNAFIGDPGQTVWNISIIFQDFNYISFTRDFFLSAIITLSYKKLEKAFKYLKDSHRSRSQSVVLIYDLVIQSNVIELIIRFPENDFIKFTTALKNIDLNEIINSQNEIRRIEINYSKKDVIILIETKQGQKTYFQF